MSEKGQTRTSERVAYYDRFTPDTGRDTLEVFGLQEQCEDIGLANRAQQAGFASKAWNRCLMRTLLPVLIFTVAPTVLAAAPPGLPWPPCAGELPSKSHPDYTAAEKLPAVEVWNDVYLDKRTACGGRLQGDFSVVVAIAGSFRFFGTLNELAERVGAISQTVNLQYWSTSDQNWRILISEASAVREYDGDWRSNKLWRPDFTAAEIRSGEMLWFRQNDTRSTGLNLYSMRALQSTPTRLAVEIVNESPISFTLIELFGEHELVSLHVIERLDRDLWGYYGLGGVHGKTFDGYERSAVNRAVAFFRFLQGKPGNAEPPLAK